MKKIVIMSIMSAIFGLFSCSAQTDGFKSMEVNDFEKAIADTNVVRVDVRTPEEYAAGHIENAINIDVLSNDFEQKACTTLPKEISVPRETGEAKKGVVIAVYCRSGKRSKKAAGILVKNKYNVIELNTGYLGWTGAGKKTVKTEPQEQMTGAYTSERAITKEELKLFNDTYKGEVKLSPVSVSTQVVAGTNYQYVCKDDKGNKYEVVIYQKLPCYGGEAEVTSIEKIK